MRVSLPMMTIGLRQPRRISAWPYALPRRSTKSAEIAPSPTRPRMPSVPKYLRDMGSSGAGAARDGSGRRGLGRGLAHEQREQGGELVAHLASVADQVDGAVLEQEFRA